MSRQNDTADDAASRWFGCFSCMQDFWPTGKQHPACGIPCKSSVGAGMRRFEHAAVALAQSQREGRLQRTPAAAKQSVSLARSSHCLHLLPR